MKSGIVIPILLIIIIVGIIALLGRKFMSKSQSVTKVNKSESPTPSMIIDKNKKYQARVLTTEGDFLIEFFTDKTPVTVNNFIYLTKKGFYKKTVFHRVIKDFMIQGGDPKGDGTGGPGYRFDDEKFEGEYLRGTIAMANAGPNTNGSQFFILHKDYPLPKQYIIFGKVIEGIETIDKIAEGEVTLNESGEPSKPVKPVSINSIEIVERP